MTELISKPVVKLPRKRQTLLLADHEAFAANTDFLVSDKLYVDPLPPTVTEADIIDLLRSCEPIEADLSTGVIQFKSVEKADRAYTLFNGATIKDSNCQLQLRAHSSGTYGEPEANSGILSIYNLPLHINNHLLYDVFRPFGPMALCKIIMDQGQFKGTALVQYFRSTDADAAGAEMNNKNVQGSIITVSPFVPKKMRHHSGELESMRESIDMSPVASQQHHQNRPVSMYYTSNATPAPPQQHEKASANIDYTNLYIKNLDLTVDSPDLFRHFYDCGRIISARVMKNAQTKHSKGFGFVSFSKAEEASRALKEKNNTYIKTKQIIVAFHEPKKPRNKNNTNMNGNSNGTSNFEKSNSNMNGHSLSSPSTLQTTYPPHYRSHDLLRRYSQPGIPSHPPPPYMPVAPAVTEYVPYSAAQQLPSAQSEYHHQRISSNNDNTRKQNSNTNINKPYRPPMMVQSQQQQQQQPPPPSLTTLASGAYINIPPPAAATTPVPQQQPLPPTAIATTTTPISNNAMTTSGIKGVGPIVTQVTATTPRPTLRRRGSTESVSSVMTETSTNMQKQRLAKAVIKCGEKEDVDDIVDMLLTLNRKERSICLFNSDYLKEKIALAKTALETFQEEEEEQENNDDKPMITRNPPMATAPSPPSATMNNATRTPIADTRPKSRAIPIVAPASSSTATKPTTATTLPSPTRTEIDQFLASIESLSIHEKKQKLGDRLFPCVKATGVKHAPRITIRLLDTVPLDVLAHSMNDKVALKAKVDAAVASMS
ncbi:RNA-binding domain-containing protein [Lichtheimia hyalospora FSU 10163]|nr:RNA-binding domain-containing protein [Lichtheimia hyalospora FSU 10163]